jgi:isochorismate pyruvate lyase
MREPEACRDLGEIREEVDRIDRTLIELLAQRRRYGRAAVRFKASEADIANTAYLPLFLDRRRAWGQEAGLPPGHVQALFGLIADASITEQLRVWREGPSR